MKIPKISSIEKEALQDSQKRWDSLIKPVGSLGRLEEIVSRISAIQQKEIPEISKKRLVVFAADHGVTEEGVSAYPQEVTVQMVRNFLSGNAAISILARLNNIDLKIVDMGMQTEIQHDSLLKVRIASGTKNFVHQPAMTSVEMNLAMEAGIWLAEEAKESGIQLLAGGDMGIGNTTSASTIYSSLLNLDPSEVTGSGAGLSERGRLHKVEVIRNALRKHSIPSTDPLEILRCFGGFEIAALTGFYLGGSSRRIPMLVDGFICSAAACIAIRLSPECKDYLFFSHASAETGHSRILECFKIHPVLDLGMRLGEGTGAAIAMQILEAGVTLFREMPTFQQAEVSGRKSGSDKL